MLRMMSFIADGAQSSVYNVKIKTPSGNIQDLVVKVYKNRNSFSCDPQIEGQILTHVPPHENIIGHRGSGEVLIDDVMSRSAIFLEKHESTLTKLLQDPAFILKCTYGTLIDLCLGITSGLQHLHEHGVVHLDLKPDNILISRTGRAVIGDLGSAKLNISGKTSFTASFRGTPKYIAPELWVWGMHNLPPGPRQRNLRINESCDIYSLGILMWKLFHNPKDSETDAFWCETGEWDCHSVPLMEVGHTSGFWNATWYKCQAPEPIRQLIKDCVHFDLSALERGEKQMTRPHCAEVYSRLLGMRNSSWASERMSRFIQESFDILSEEILSAPSDLQSEPLDEATEGEHSRGGVESTTVSENGDILRTFSGLSVSCSDKLLGSGPHGEVKEGIIYSPSGKLKNGKEVVVKFDSLVKSHTWGLPNRQKSNLQLPEHENVATIYGYGVHIGSKDMKLNPDNYDIGPYTRSFIVIEKLPRNLNHLLFEDNAFAQKCTVKDVLDISIGITEGLHHLHLHNVSHCNLKPSNILIGEDSSKIVVRVSDYGLTKICSSSSFDEAGWGTQGYIAPELLLLGDDSFADYDCSTPESVAADVFSLGTIMYQMLSRCLDVTQYIVAEEFEEDASIKINTVPEPVRLACRAPVELRALIEECLLFNFDDAAQGIKQFDRPTLDNILQRLKLMRHEEWAEQRVHAYAKFCEDHFSPMDGESKPSSDQRSLWTWISSFYSGTSRACALIEESECDPSEDSSEDDHSLSSPSIFESIRGWGSQLQGDFKIPGWWGSSYREN